MSCNIIENAIASRHSLCMKTSSVYHVCHMTKRILNEKKCVKTCVGIWMINHTNYMPHIGMSNWVVTYLTRRKQVLIVMGLMFILLQDMKWQSNININIQHDEECQECDNGGYKETCES